MSGVSSEKQKIAIDMWLVLFGLITVVHSTILSAVLGQVSWKEMDTLSVLMIHPFGLYASGFVLYLASLAWTKTVRRGKWLNEIFALAFSYGVFTLGSLAFGYVWWMLPLIFGSWHITTLVFAVGLGDTFNGEDATAGGKVKNNE